MKKKSYKFNIFCQTAVIFMTSIYINLTGFIDKSNAAQIYTYNFDNFDENMKVYQDKKTIFLSTSPGPNGGATVLGAASGGAPFQGANLLASIPVGSFYDIYDAETDQITNNDVNEQLKEAVGKLSDTANIAAA